MPFSIPAGSDEEAFEIERQVHAYSDRLVGTDAHNGYVNVMCPEEDDEELIQVLINARVTNILSAE